MARLAIRKVRYEGKLFTFTSPDLPDGLVIVEGENGVGKTTFADLIYFGLGGNPEKFKRDGKKKLVQITSDTENFVEITIETNSEKFRVMRYINSNDIAVFSETETVGIFPVFRGKASSHTFSDWLLHKLGINPVVIHFQRHHGVINFTDLLRLMYHDQSQNPERIFKQLDSSNGLVSDSVSFRKAIFEILVGRDFGEYYQALNELRQGETTISETKGAILSFASAMKCIGHSEDWNINRVMEELKTVQHQLDMLIGHRAAIRENSHLQKPDLNSLDLRNQLNSIYLQISEEQSGIIGLQSEMSRLQELQMALGQEIDHVKKIMFTHEQLSLFSEDTCPYCLERVSRTSGKCICGSNIDESTYTRFFYNTSEYMKILKSKEKNLSTLADALTACSEDLKVSKMKINSLEQQAATIRNGLANKPMIVIDFSKLTEIDDKIMELKSAKDSLEKQCQLEQTRQELENKLTELQRKTSQQSIRVDALEAAAREQMVNTVERFSSVYSDLLRETISNCRRARLDEAYMPVLNDGEHIEASAVVPKRLMYFLTLLTLSLENRNLPFPKFLLIDTPDTNGIDEDNLRKSIGKISEILPDPMTNSWQTILTTGSKSYPESLERLVVVRLSKDKKLLQKKE